MGDTVSAGANNDELVDNLLEANYIKTPAVERVFRAVDRGHYFTVEYKDCAYKDLAWKYGNLHISAPCIYSEVMENLRLAPGMSFLNLGSGTGYLSTMAGLILGSYGINHGVEIHEDVLDYAKKKLDEFCSTSPAMDEYEFCQPKFVNGNCLHLESEARQYDRVYCGAACPENHQNYMKNLIKVGGILVMPINNTLLQIHRLTDTIWSTKPVLPVSFASLICNKVPSSSEPLKMPDTDPPSLQDICRFAVRSILRRKIDLEHPELKKRPSRVPRKRVKKRALRKIVIPFFDTEETTDYEIDESLEIGTLTRQGFLMDVHNVPSCRALLELGQGLPGSSVRSPSRSEEDTQEQQSEPRKAAEDGIENDTTKEKGVQTLESEFHESWESESREESGENDVEMLDSSGVEEGEELMRHTAVKDGGRREKFDSGIVEDIENGKGSDSDDEIYCDEEVEEEEEDDEIDEDEDEEIEEENERMKERLFYKFDDSDTETAVSEGSSSKVEKAGGTETEPEAEEKEVKNYSVYMREKIKMLPLPMTLKYFVNLDREL